MTPAMPSAADRILDAALDLFGAQGFSGTSIKAVAQQAGVSPALVIHHFGSKDALRAACDDHLVKLIEAAKTESIGSAPSLLPTELQALTRESRPTIRYLSRRLAEGGDHIDKLIDDLVASSLSYTQQAEAAGLIRPSADPKARITVLTLWSLGPLMLHEHLHRILGVDLLDGETDVMPYVHAAMEILVEGVLTPSAYPELHPPPTDVHEPSERTP